MTGLRVLAVSGMALVAAFSVLQYEVAAQWRESARQCFRDVDEILARRRPPAPAMRPTISCACAAATDQGACTVTFEGDSHTLDIRTNDMRPPRALRCYEHRDGGLVQVHDVDIRWSSER